MPSVLTERYTSLSLSLSLYPVSYTESRREKNPRIRVKVLCSRNADHSIALKLTEARATSMFMLIAVDTVAFQNLPANSGYATMATTV